MNVNKALKRISWLTRNWPGVSIDPDGLAHAINLTGSLNPVIWVFNDASAPRNFSQCFGSDQPIIAFRTLNMIVEPSSKRDQLSKEIAHLYADIIMKLVDKPIQIVGGVCQGAPFAMWIAQKLNASGYKVHGVAVIDPYPCIPNIKVDLPVLLNFGISAPLPFSKKRKEIKQQCKNIYASFQFAFSPCRHATITHQKNIKYLKKHLLKFSRQHFVK